MHYNGNMQVFVVQNNRIKKFDKTQDNAKLAMNPSNGGVESSP